MTQSIGKFFKSFHHAFQGIIFVITGRNFIIQLLMAILAVLLGLYFSISHQEWLAVIIVIFIVLSIEALNTAIEEVCNIVKDLPGLPSDITRKSRDVAAASSLLASIGALIVGLLIFSPKILGLFH